MTLSESTDDLSRLRFSMLTLSRILSLFIRYASLTRRGRRKVSARSQLSRLVHPLTPLPPTLTRPSFLVSSLSFW